MADRSVSVGVVALVAGSAAALLASSQVWVTVSLRRPVPLPAITARLAGRTVEPAVAGLALVALAGAVALLATAGVLRRAVGAALVLVGAGLIWRSVTGATVSTDRAGDLLAAKRTGAVLTSVSQLGVQRVAAWPVLSGLGGAVVALVGLAGVVWGGRWRTMSARYEPPERAVTSASVGIGAAGEVGGAGSSPASELDDEQRRQRADAALWRSVDRGEDPTV